jgi:hypothetical protein
MLQLFAKDEDKQGKGESRRIVPCKQAERGLLQACIIPVQ